MHSHLIQDLNEIFRYLFLSLDAHRLGPFSDIIFIILIWFLGIVWLLNFCGYLDIVFYETCISYIFVLK